MLLKKKKIKTLIIRVFPVVELFAWLSFIIWSSSLLFGSFDAYPIIITFIVFIIIAILAWYFLRDFISGFILRSENGFEQGQAIETPFSQGIIKKVGYRSIEIITPKGEHVKIPYTLLMNTSVIKPQDDSKWVENIINLEFSTSLDSIKVKNMLRKRLIEMPWIVSDQSIKIGLTVVDSLLQEINDSQKIKISQELQDSLRQYNASIHFYSITPETAIKTQENLKKFIEESINN